MTLRLLNLRYGFANNSSSSHSVVLLRGNARLSDDFDGNHYGWEAFTLASEEEKLKYLAAQAFQGLPRTLDRNGYKERDEASPLFADVLRLIFGREPTEAERTAAADGVDHQSEWALPVAFDGKLHTGFLQELRALLVRDDVAVLGGNDNGGAHPMEGEFPNVLGLLPRETVASIARKDPAGFWTLFDRRTGFKARFFLDEEISRQDRRERQQPEGMKAHTPELVDVKITDYCPHGCAFCYQSSTEAGKHASLESIDKLAASLRELEVFEVALGGGEPTSHPDFLAVLDAFKSRGIVVNFTTKSLDWVPKMGAEVLSRIGSFAFSATHPREVEALKLALEPFEKQLQTDAPFGLAAVSVQHVVGVVGAELLQQVAVATLDAGFQLTLLGYKQVGFGAAWKPHVFDWLPALLLVGDAQHAKQLLGRERAPTLRFAMDTALAQQSVAQLKELKVPTWMYHTKEGAFSMYVDAVAAEAGPSSYEGKPAPVSFTAEAIREAFAAY